MGRTHVSTEQKRQHNEPYLALMRERMAKDGLDQNEVAALIGVHHGTVSRWFSGSVAVTEPNAVRIRMACQPAGHLHLQPSLPPVLVQVCQHWDAIPSVFRDGVLAVATMALAVVTAEGR